MPKTTDQILREIKDKEDWQAELRAQIDALPDGHPERQSKIDLLFLLHEEIAQLSEIAQRI